MAKSYKFRVNFDAPKVLTLSGRNGWALTELIKAGKNGVTPLDTPAPRWAAYVHNLRKLGFVIDTMTEPHFGEFAGTHARYVLRTSVSRMIGGHFDAV